jgi:hypothetical protein
MNDSIPLGLDRFRACIHLDRAAAVCILTLITTLAPSPGTACVGAPPEPLCTKTLQLAIAGPPVLLLPAGGTFDVAALVYFDLLDFPAGSGICPAGPYAVDVAITATCTPSGADGSGQLLGAAIVAGYNQLTVPVTVPAGPPRLCVLEATATIVLGDGMTLTEDADNLACLAEPAPGMPGQPRLDLKLVGSPGDEIARTHPGDPAGFVYEIVNNDPSESFSGTLTVDSLNESRMPMASGPMPPGTAVVSVSDPVAGDNFPIELLAGPFDLLEGDPVGEGCIALPPDPADPGIPVKLQELGLAPGESFFVTVRSRHWGMCADGSCGRSTLTLDGFFSDATAGLACSGFVTAADTSRPPSYACDDSGDTVQFPPPPDPLKLTSVVTPRPGLDLEIDLEVTQSSLTVDGFPANAAIPFSGLLDPDRGRIQLQFAESFAVDSFFDIGLRAQFLSSSEELTVVGNWQAAAPTGFESQAPLATAQVRVESNTSSELLGFFQPGIQVSAVGIDNLGERRPLSFEEILFVVLPGGDGIDIVLGDGTVGPGGGTGLDAIELAMDQRGFMAPEAQSSVVFEDGFESGNTSRWSLSTP